MMAVGTAAPPRTAAERPTPPFRQRHSSLLATVAGAGAAAVAGIAHVIASRSISQPAGEEEATVAANAYALTRLGSFEIPDSLSDRVVSIHVALYDELTGAADRNASLAGALREVLLVFVVTGALALFTLCRQFGLTTPTAVGVVLLGYLAPAVTSAQVIVYSATIATTWLLVAAVVLSARPTAVALTWLTRALGVLLVALAAVIEPVALLLPAGVLAMAMITGTVFPRWGAVRRTLAVAGVMVFLAIVGAVGFDFQTSGDTSRVARVTIIALAVAGLVLGAIATWRVLWVRPLALGSVPLFVAALPPWEARASAIVIGLPIVAVLLGAIVEETVTTLRRPGPAVVRGGAGALVIAVAIGLLVLPASATDSVQGAPQTELAAWLTGNVPAETTVAVDPLLWVELLRAGVPAERLQRTDSVASDVPPATLMAERGEQSTELPLVARFGEGPLAVAVRERVGDVDLAAAAVTAERAASQEFGAELATNSNLILDDAAEADLGSGNVDSRLLTVLATAAADFQFTIDSFPRTNGADDAGTLRTVRISEIADVTTAGVSEESENIQLRDFFRYQLPSYRPLSQGFDAGVLVVVYSAPSPVGLLS